MTPTRKLVSVVFSVLLSISCSVSKAQTVSVPLVNGLSVTVSTGQATLQNLYQNPAATNVTMGDDSNVNVPLQFDFPYFGKTFKNSWMYSNGAVTFQDGWSAGSFCCSGADLRTLNNTAFNYSIVPLWTDLIAIQGGSHYTLGTPTSMTYGWYGVSEYYDPSKRSTFEVKIDNTGLVDVKFSGAMISYHPVTSGFIGDLAKGEYYQYYYGVGFNSGPFSYTLNGGPAPADPCKDNPLYSPTCAGYAQALALTTLTSTTTATQPVAAEPVATTSTTTTAAPVTEPVQTQTTATAPTTTSAPTTTTTTTVTAVSSTPARVGEVASAPSASKPTVSLSTILSIVSAEQSRISKVESAVVQDATSTAAMASANAVANAESTAMSAAGASSSGTGITPLFGGSSIGIKSSIGTVSALSTNFSDRMIIDLLQQRPDLPQDTQQQQQSSSVKRGVADNQAAGGVTIASIASQPSGFNAYFTVVPDVQFYQTKEIYRNQSVVDNNRALRQLSSDRLHHQLVDLQYNNNKGN